MFLLGELVIFVLTFSLGIFTAYQLGGYGKIIEETVSVRPIIPQISLLEFLLIFFIATFCILLSLKIFKRGIFFKIIFALGLWSGLETIFLLIFSPPLALLLGLAFVLLVFLVNRVGFFNLALILGLAGIGASLGFYLAPLTSLLILVILSFYDFLAVYKTKQMVKMFQGLVERKVFLCFILPRKIKDLNLSLEKVVIDKDFMFLGGGDVVLPLFLGVGVLRFGLENALGVAFGALVGAIVNYLIFIRQKERQPMPALPIIALFSVLGLLVVTFL